MNLWKSSYELTKVSHPKRSEEYYATQLLFFSLSVVSNSLLPHGLQHTRPPCPSLFPGVYSDSCPLSQWCHSTISSSVAPFSSCPQSFPKDCKNESLEQWTGFMNAIFKWTFPCMNAYPIFSSDSFSFEHH